MSERVAVVTGSTGGVGRAVALHLAKEGYTVCGLGRNKEKLATLEREATRRIELYQCDIADAAEVSSIIDTITDRFGAIDVLVNNAATFEMKKFEYQSVETIDRIIDTNLKGLMYVTHYALPAVLKSGNAHIINISSVAGTYGIPEQSIYCASKHGVVGFGDALAQELKDRGVKVTTLCPGGIKTPLWNNETNPYPGNVENLMDPEEIVDLIDFILNQPRHTLHKKLVFFPINEWH